MLSSPVAAGKIHAPCCVMKVAKAKTKQRTVCCIHHPTIVGCQHNMPGREQAGWLAGMPECCGASPSWMQEILHVKQHRSRTAVTPCAACLSFGQPVGSCSKLCACLIPRPANLPQHRRAAPMRDAQYRQCLFCCFSCCGWLLQQHLELGQQCIVQTQVGPHLQAYA